MQFSGEFPMSLPQETIELLKEIEETVDTYRGYL